MVNQRISLKDVDVALDGTILGGAEELAMTLNADDEPAHEGGTYLPAEIVDGKVTITGTLTRAFIDVALLNQIFPSTGGPKPSFTLSGTINNSKSPGRTVKIFGVKFNAPDINGFALDGYAKNSLPFNATRWKFDV